MDDVSLEEYLAGRYVESATGNPQDIGGPFRFAMIRSRLDSYSVRKGFGDPATFGGDGNGDHHKPVWSFQRQGQSEAVLPDGRTVFIGGSHEDWYDPDFCIYNDVAVVEADGKVSLFGYPMTIFPPTDWHSATLVGPDIFIIGSLGYKGDRTGSIRIHRLMTEDFHIEPLTTTGDIPPHLSQHHATYLGDGVIRIEGGFFFSQSSGEEKHVENPDIYELNTGTLRWERVHRSL